VSSEHSRSARPVQGGHDKLSWHAARQVTRDIAEQVMADQRRRIAELTAVLVAARFELREVFVRGARASNRHVEIAIGRIDEALARARGGRP
jgi:hypothetical protein